MSKRSKTNIILLSSGTLVYSLHYGPFSRYWWYSTTIENKIQLVPIRLGMTISIFLNSQEFIMRIVQEHSNHSQQPGYYCQAGKFFSNIEESCSAALTSLYQQIFQNNRKLSGPLELGLDDENIINQLLDGVLFQPFLVSFNKFQIFIYSLDNQTNLTFASSLVYIYHKKKCLFVQTREKTLYKIEIFDGSMLIATFEGKSTIEVWQKIGILQKLDSSALFELNDDYTKKQLELHELPTCQSTDWTNFEIMNRLFLYYLKRHTLYNINWWSVFLKWAQNISGIIEIWSIIRKIYPSDYEFNDREIRAWRAFLKAAGCTNITPFESKMSKYEFWTKEMNPLRDQETLYTLYKDGFLCTTPSYNLLKPINFTNRLANCLLDSYEANKKGVEGKRKILSIIADEFSLKELRLMKFFMPYQTIQEARRFARINGPGCPIIEKPIIHRNRFSEEAKDQFEKFFSDKSIVNMSSYKIDLKTQLPVLYLKDNKSALWEKYSEIYPDGIKRTTFMTELAQGRFQYQNDLGGLCSICCQYGYNVFKDLLELISVQIKDTKCQSSLIEKVEKIRRHIKRDYEKEIILDANGQVIHDPCISHCLAYAFGVCENIHTNVCKKCNELWELFQQLRLNLDKSYFEILDEAYDKLCYYLSHQTRKTYLNSQFSVSLREIDEDGALIVVDYKMRVLPKSARESKEAFFGKKGWTLHTTLVYTKKEKNKLDICAFDHWSNDTRQDAWFSASSLHSVITALEKKPKWVSIISDNGGHYHNSELMIILSYWYQWYNIKVKKWIFLEPGEAKTTIDSHHAQIAHAIRHFVQLGNDLTSGEKIETAITHIRGTSVAQLEPNRNTETKVKTLTGISEWYYWQWPCEGIYDGYIQARELPNVGKWTNFSPSQINCLIKQPINKPEPACTSHSVPKESWRIPIPDASIHLNPERMRLSEIRNELMQRNILFDENCDRTELKTLLQQTLDAEKNSELLPPNQNSISLPNPSIQYTNTIEEQYPLPKGWAIKGKQKFGKKGGAHISKEVADLLKGYFHAGNANSSQRYQPEDMLRALNKKADNNELDRTQIPKLETIRNWISRYSIVIKKEIAEKMLTSLNNNSEK